MTSRAHLATTPEHYRRLGITGTIEPFEDGLRTDPARSGHYEWWYFDAHLDDGATIVVTFYTKDYAAPSGGLAPMITIDLDLPDGRTINKRAVFDPTEFTASTEGCDVRIAGHRFVGDLHEYDIGATIDDLAVTIRLTGTTEPWRPATGHIVYGDDEALTFAWLPSVPHGRVTVTYRVGDHAVTTGGHGYHDHNWGNAPLLSVVNNWYWGRGAVGPYTFITAFITSEKKYGHVPVTVFMVAKDGAVVAEDHTATSFARSAITVDGPTGKPVADDITFTHEDAQVTHVLRYRRDTTILRVRFLDTVGRLKRIAGRLVGFDGCYLRFTGTVTLTVTPVGGAPEQLAAPAIWELMYFGKHAHEVR